MTKHISIESTEIG